MWRSCFHQPPVDLYLLTLGVGFGGLLLMAFLGVSHSGHGHHHGHGHHSSHGRGHTGQGLSPVSLALTLLSPRIIFSLLLGFGAAGLLLRPLLTATPLLLVAAAVAGGVVFERWVVQPVWRLLFNFASQPARTLDSAVLEEGKAVTNFDANGQGLIAFQLDGQVRQILATLCEEDRAAGGRVRAGDRLFIRAVDGERNRCTVARVP